MEAVHHAHRHAPSRCAAATSTPTRSSRPSTSSGSPAPASRTACSPPGARTRRSSSTSPQYAGRLDPGRRARLRHRLVARARGLGAAGLRLPGRHLARGSPTSSAATRCKAGLLTGAVCRRTIVEQLWTLRRGRPGHRGDRRPGAPARSRAGDVDGRRSRSTTTPAGGCWRGSTTSALTLRHEADDHRLRALAGPGFLPTTVN